MGWYALFAEAPAAWHHVLPLRNRLVRLMQSGLVTVWQQQMAASFQQASQGFKSKL